MKILAIDPGPKKTKKCSHCLVTKPLDMFYQNKNTKDRRGSWCKQCERERNRIEYTKRYRESASYFRAQQKYRKSHKHKAINKKYMRYIRQTEPDKCRARDAVKYALITGDLTKPARCEKCHSVSKRLHGHHKSYKHRLDVLWLCPKCHYEVHIGA